MAQKQSKLKIQAIGTSYQDVTGSMTLLTYKKSTIAIDCGYYQGHSKYSDYQINKSMFKNTSVKSIEAVVCTHLNADHILNIPSLFNQGGSPVIYMVDGSYEVAGLMFRDSLKIMDSDIIYFNKKYGKDHKPLFDENDVEKALYNVIEQPYNEKVKINDYFSIEFIPSGHIYLSAQVIVHVEDGRYKKKVAFTGDLGNIHLKKPTVEEFKPIKTCDVLVGECTYAMTENKCTKAHKEQDLTALKLQIDKTCGKNQSRVLIASFALQRALDILADLYAVWEREPFDYPVYLDSPLSVNILETIKKQCKDEIFDKLAGWKNLKYVTTYNETKSILYSKGAGIVVSSNAFAQGGRIMTHFTEVLPDSKSCLVTAGYSGTTSNMGMIKQRKPIKIMHEGDLKEYKINCEILELHSYSSHMQHDDLLNYYSSVNCKTVILNHGEGVRKYQFAKLLDDKIRKMDKTTRVLVCEKSDVVEV